MAQIKEEELLYHVTLSVFKFRVSILENLNQIEAKKKIGDFLTFYIDLTKF